MPGRPLPPIPKNANVSITLSRTMVRAVVIHSAKQSSIQVSVLRVGPGTMLLLALA